MDQLTRLYPLRTTTWRCGCRPHGAANSLARKTCPHCGAPMPQTVRDRVYEEVSEELRIKCRQDRQRRWRDFCHFCVEKWPLTLLVLFLIFIAVFRIVAPDAFRAIVDNVSGTIHDTGAFISNTAGAIGRFFQGLGRVLGAIGRFLMVLLKGIW